MNPPKTYHVRFEDGLDSSAGNPLADFSFPWLEEAVPHTEFRAVHDGNRLGFAFRVEDADLVLGAAEDPGEGALGSDRVELFFSPSPDLLPHYFGAEMDPSGRVYDYRAVYHRQFDPSWSFSTLRFAGRVVDGGYHVEGTIDLNELRELDVLRDGEMVVGVYRAEFSHAEEGIREEWISWVVPDSAVPDFHIPSSFGRFQLQPADA